MTERPERPGGRNPRVTHTQVLRVERLTPHMFRIVLGGPGLAGFTAGEYTDHYIKLLFPAEGVTYPEPFDFQRIRADLPREQWPRMRTYTVRRWDAERRELTVDIVHHGDEGLAGPWVSRVRPGDEVRFAGSGGGYAPDPDADWHLPAGDESARTSRREAPRRSCTVRRASSRRCDGCCSSSGGFPGNGCPSRATGGSARTRTAGRPPSGSGTAGSSRNRTRSEPAWARRGVLQPHRNGRLRLARGDPADLTRVRMPQWSAREAPRPVSTP